MAADASIFASLLRPPKTVQDYQNDDQQAEGNKLALLMQRQQVAEGTSKLQDASSRRNALRDIYAQNPDPTARMQALLNDPLTAADGAAQQKAIGEAAHVASQTRQSNSVADKNSYETQVAKADKAVTDIAGYRSPQEALQALQAHAQAGDIDPQKAAMLTQQIQQSGAQPGGFAQWQVGMLRNILGAKDRLTLDQQKAIADQSNATSIANNTATNNTSRANNQATVGATLNGQRLTDARAGATQTETARHNGATEAAAASNDKALTEGQAKAYAFGSRMTDARSVVDELEGKGTFNRGKIKAGAEALGRVVGLGTDSMGGTLGDLAGGAMNFTQSADQQRYEGAKRNWIAANLRKESGASIGQGEYRDADNQYFPQPGDDKAAVEDKRRRRQIAEETMLAEVPAKRRGGLSPAATKPAAEADIHAQADAILAGKKK